MTAICILLDSRLDGKKRDLQILRIAVKHHRTIVATERGLLMRGGARKGPSMLAELEGGRVLVNEYRGRAFVSTA